MMSTPGDGPAFLRPEPGRVRDDAFAAAWAELEARRILAETEPGMLEVIGTPYEQSVPLWVRTFRCDPDNRFRAALAESLAAFVGRE
jgi:hypothetical protein